MDRSTEGIPWKDAKKDITLTLVRADAIGAVCADPQRCVIAQALLRRRGVLDVRVIGSRALVRCEKTPDEWTRYVLSSAGCTLTADFDKYGASPYGVSGTKVTLKAPQGKQRIGGRAGEAPGTDVRSGNKAPRRRPLVAS